MSRSKGVTPIIQDHPANKLTFVDEEIKNQLLKTPPQLLLENENYKVQLKDLRNNWKYAFVLQWLTFFRGAIKLSGELFTVDLIEEELVGLTESNLIPKIAINLATALIGTKVSIDDFGFRIRYLFGDTINLLGTEDEPKEFNQLSLIDKFEVLYHLINQLQYTEVFRKQVEKYEKENELRFEPIFEIGEESFFLLSDNRIYKRIISTFPNLNLFKNYNQSKNNINLEIELPDIEPNFQWKNIAIGIYEIHDFLESIKSIKKYKPLFNNIKEYINDIANDDLITRKKIVKRKKEQQLNELVTHRKRSSRIQMKEEQLRIDKEKEEAEIKRQKKEKLKAKIAKKTKQKEIQIKKNIEERLRRNTIIKRGNSPPLKLNMTSNLNNIKLEEGEWLFECGCGLKEKNYDDGVKLIVCERCQRWQHLKCQDRIVQQELVRDSTEVFICNCCKQDFEIEIIKKLEDEKIQKLKEIEEKLKQKELEKQLEQNERKKKEEFERIKKEELEKERQKRILEREKLKDSSNSTLSPVNILNLNHPQPKFSTNQQLKPEQLPRFGSFQVSPQQHYQPQSLPSQFQQQQQQQLQFENSYPQSSSQENFQQDNNHQQFPQKPFPEHYLSQPFPQHQQCPPQHTPQQQHQQISQPQASAPFNDSDNSPSKSYSIQNILQ